MDKRTKLDLGSGFENKGSEWVRIDISSKCNPDYCWDITDIPYPEEWAWENKFNNIRIDNLAEHIEPYTWIKVVNELHRISKPNGILWIRVPNMEKNIPMAMTDPTHVNYFFPGTFDYYDVGHKLKRWELYGRCYGIPKFQRVRQKEDSKFIIVELKILK